MLRSIMHSIRYSLHHAQPPSRVIRVTSYFSGHVSAEVMSALSGPGLWARQRCTWFSSSMLLLHMWSAARKKPSSAFQTSRLLRCPGREAGQVTGNTRLNCTPPLFFVHLARGGGALATLIPLRRHQMVHSSGEWVLSNTQYLLIRYLRLIQRPSILRLVNPKRGSNIKIVRKIQQTREPAGSLSGCQRTGGNKRDTVVLRLYAWETCCPEGVEAHSKVVARTCESGGGVVKRPV
jgi:hypothetical protein